VHCNPYFIILTFCICIRLSSGSCRSRARVGLANHRPPTWSLRLLPRPRQSLHAASASEAESSVDEDREKKLFEKMSKSQLEDLYTRLCENDVEYNDMKVS